MPPAWQRLGAIDEMGVPSIAFNQQHEAFLFWFLRTSDEVMPRSQEGRPTTTNVTRKIQIEKEDDWMRISERLAVRVCMVGLR